MAFEHLKSYASGDGGPVKANTEELSKNTVDAVLTVLFKGLDCKASVDPTEFVLEWLVELYTTSAIANHEIANRDNSVLPPDILEECGQKVEPEIRKADCLSAALQQFREIVKT